jgi:hypothetical protein
MTCPFCGKDPGVFHDCCREAYAQFYRELSAEDERKRAAYAVECANEDERLVG